MFEKLFSIFFEQKYKTVLRTRFKILFPILILLILFFWRNSILVAIGKYLEMKSTLVHVDAVIVEGGETVSRLKIDAALGLVRRGYADKIVVTLTGKIDELDVFGLRHYDKMIAAAFDSLAIPAEKYFILPLDVTDPFTYHLAIETAKFCAEQNFQAVYLIHDGFHIRRSYLAYKKQLQKYGIGILPYSIQIYVDASNWWQSPNGARRVFGEYIKLAFYKFKGYI